MPSHAVTLTVETRGKGTYEITRDLQRAVRESGVATGIAAVLVQHTSASLVLMENADPEARHDLHGFLDRLVPEDTPWFTHTYEGPDDMPSHIRMVFTGPGHVIPVHDGQPALGTWQGLFLFEHRRAPHVRRVALTITGD